MDTAPQFPKETSDEGEFKRQEDRFREWVACESASAFPAEPGRYHLYVSLACPWAHRTIIMRKLKGLEAAVGMTVVDPIRTDQEGWAFREVPGASRDPINGFSCLREAYLASDPTYSDRVTVPVLWDKQTRRILSNSDDDIMRMFNCGFAEIATKTDDYYPPVLREEINQWNELIYETVNDGVYRAGFATTQMAYENSVRKIFEILDLLEDRLTTNRFMFGKQLTETDWRLFVTLIRFDPVYYGHFKCNLRRIVDYPNLHGYLKELYQHPGVAETVDFDHIKRHYYMTHEEINPTCIVPVGPLLNLDEEHGRNHL